MDDQQKALKMYRYMMLAREQEEYDNYWVRNSWGFGDRMRDYLLEGWRRIRFEPLKQV